MNGKTCPLSPTRIHRVYYSARRGGKTWAARHGAACCRDCGVDVYFIGRGWEVPPPGEILVGLQAEFQARMIEGDPDGIRNPLGIFGAAGSARPAYSFTIVPPMPGIVS